MWSFLMFVLTPADELCCVSFMYRILCWTLTVKLCMAIGERPRVCGVS
jgi:hypothetical protein